MDNDTLRRGMPTCHVKYGEDVAILAGDALLTQAFHTAAMCTCRAEVLVEILKLLSDFSGANGMILGQIKDLEGEANPSIDHAGLQDIHYYKTGRLLLSLIHIWILIRISMSCRSSSGSCPIFARNRNFRMHAHLVNS